MANYITSTEFTEITGVTGSQCGETEASTDIRDAAIAKAQIQVLKELNKISFAGTETDYSLVQSAIAFFAAHRISLRNQPLSLTSELMSPFKIEYKELLRVLKTTEEEIDYPILPASGGFDSVTIDDID